MNKEQITGKEKAYTEHTFMTSREVCDLLRVTRQTVWLWKKKGMPFVEPIVGPGGKLLYPTAEVVAWLEKRRCGATAEGTKAERTKAEMVAWLERKCAGAEASKAETSKAEDTKVA